MAPVLFFFEGARLAKSTLTGAAGLAWARSAAEEGDLLGIRLDEDRVFRAYLQVGREWFVEVCSLSRQEKQFALVDQERLERLVEAVASGAPLELAADWRSTSWMASLDDLEPR